MSDDITAKVFAGVERMLAASASSVLTTVRDMIDAAVKQVPAGPAGTSGQKGEAGARGTDGVPGRDGRDGLPGIAGSTGARGEKGGDGRDGKDGKDGITLEQLGVALEASLTNLLSKTIVVGRDLKIGEHTVARLAFQEYKGVWVAGEYERGDNVTFGGNQWTCIVEKTLDKPDGTSRDWQLSTKRGRDGKDKV